jgi:hypothetical protein
MKAPEFGSVDVVAPTAHRPHRSKMDRSCSRLFICRCRPRDVTQMKDLLEQRWPCRRHASGWATAPRSRGRHNDLYRNTLKLVHIETTRPLPACSSFRQIACQNLRHIIGKETDLSQRFDREDWEGKIVDRLSKDLQAEFPRVQRCSFQNNMA